MAELLIKGIDATHVNPDKDKRGCYKIGMVVDIRDDGCIYGLSECPPCFYKIKIPGIPKNHPLLLELIKTHETVDETEKEDITKLSVLRRRKCWIKYADIPTIIKKKLERTGEIFVKAAEDYKSTCDSTWEDIKSCFWNDDIKSSITNELR